MVEQNRIARHPARYKIVACGRRWGKTTLGLAMACHHAVAGHRVWWVAPTYLMSFHPWRAFKSRFSSSWEQKNETDKHIDLKNGGSITVKTADNPDGLRGVGLDFVVVDEAAFLDELAWEESLRPALLDRNGSALLISTPHGRNWFQKAYLKGLDRQAHPDWFSWRYPTSTNPLLPRSAIDEARLTQPERIFKQEYEAEFLEDGGSVFRGLQRAMVDPSAVEFNPSHQYVMGIDFARYQDFTACVVIDATAHTVVAVDRYTGVEWGLQRARIKGLATKWQVWDVLAEINSMGDPNINLLREDGVPIRGFNTSPASKPPLIENLVASIENGDLRLLPDPALIGELEAFSYRQTDNGYTIYRAPHGHHDDTVIALALAWKATSGSRIVLGMA
jgi:hypothetical protein